MSEEIKLADVVKQNKYLEESKDNSDIQDTEVTKKAFFERFIRTYKKLFYEIKRESTTRSKF
jgi:hypothetical protein